MNPESSNRLQAHAGDFLLTRFAVALAVGTGLLAGCGGKHESPAAAPSAWPTVQVNVQTVASKRQATTEEVVGTVRAKHRATLEAKLSGRIDKLPVRLGQPVAAGQLVANLDAEEIKARLDQAQAARDQAERDWKRASSLFEVQAVTRSDYDAADARHRVANAAVAEAQAMLDYLEVRAPFDGVVTRKWVEVGDLAMPGKPLIEIEDPSALQLDADAPETVAAQIQPGARLAVRLDSVPGELLGTVVEIAPTADPVSRTFRVKLDLQIPHSAFRIPHFLRSGQFARLMVPIGETLSLRVPAAAVVQRGQLEIAFVLTNQHAQLHLVKTGKHIGDEVEILSGLDPGDVVVTGGAALLTDGQPAEAR